MSSGGHDIDWLSLIGRRNAYRNKLIKKGVVDGSLKMMQLMARKHWR